MPRRLLFPVLAVAVLVAGCAMPQLDEYRAAPLAQTSFLYASDGTLITELHAAEDRVVLTRREMPQELRDAVVAIEDRRFFLHHGVDLQAILRAAYQNLAEGAIVEGGSTITQQLVKQAYVGADRTFRRKIDEAVLAWQLEDRLTKDQILTRYLNTVYLGNGAYGVQAGARTYFGIDAEDLSLAQSATLAALITSPGRFDPFTKPDSAVGRRNVVLRLMRQQGYLTRAEAGAAREEELGLDPGEDFQRYPYPYFVDYFKQWFLSNPAFGKTRDDRYRRLFTGGLTITTTLDPSIQAAAQTAVRSVLPYPDDPSAAVTVLDPRTGYVRALVGGRDVDYWHDAGAGRVNLATMMGGRYGRQTGSAFKPFALVTALENGVSPETIFAAPSEIDIPLDGGQVWHVTNAEGGGYGSMSLRSATVSSVNTVYAQLIMQLGPEKVIETAARMGLRCCLRVSRPGSRDPLLPYPSAVLGANGTNTLSMASAYGTLATGGTHVNPVPAIAISDRQGRVIWEASPKPSQVVDPGVAAAANDILKDVVLYGTGAAANIDGRPQIGKTGTADSHTNAWFVGAVPQLVTAVWVGFPEGSVSLEPPRTRITVFGGTWPAQIWRLIMLRATANLPPVDFPTPEVDYLSVAVDVTQDPLCLPNAFTLPENVQTFEFIAGTEPTKTCRTPTSSEPATVPSVIGLSQSEAESILRAAGFFVSLEVGESTQPVGSVIAQTPSAGITALQTSTVTITVSAAPPEEG
jgi:penicillin-binding protein 1A